MDFNILKLFESKKTPPPDSFIEVSTQEDFELNAFFKGLTYNPDKLVGRKGLKIYDQMRNDDQIKVTQTLKKHAVLAAGWAIEPASEEDSDIEVAKFTETSFEEMDGSLDNDILEIMTAQDYGYSITEKLFKVLDEDSKFPGKIGWKALKTRRPHFFQFRQDEFGNILDDGIVQFRFLGGEKDLPLSKFILYSYNSEFGNPYGRSELRSAYRPWWSKTNYYKWWAMYMERFAQPITKGKYGANVSKEHQNKIKTMLETLRARTSILVPEGVEVDFLEAKRKGSASYIESIDALDLAIARALLMPSLIGMTPDDSTGSFSRAKKNFDVFMLILERVRRELEELMNEQAIKEIVDFNFVVEEYPKFKFLPLTEENRQQIADIWLRAVQIGAVFNRPEDENQLRALIGFEELDEDKIKERAEVEQPPEGREKGRGEEAEEEEFNLKYQRKPNDIESKVDFQRIERNFDKIEAQTSEVLVDLFTQQKTDLLSLLKRKIDKDTLTAKFINKELRLKNFQKIQSTIGQLLRSSHDLGRSDLAREAGKPDKFQLSPLLPEQAIKALEDKKFWVTGLMRDDLLNEVKGTLLEALRTGASFTEIQEQINDIYIPFIGDPTAIRPDGKATTPFRIETVIRTNLNDAYNAGRQAMGEDPDLADFIIGWEFSEILDSRTTPISLEVDGQKVKKDDPDLVKLRYPLHFNDRGMFVPVTTDDLPVKWITKSKKDKVKRMMKGFR
jgi:phage gp29-like protein